MRTDNMIELNLEEMEAVSGGFWEEIGDFGWRLWDKVKDVVYRLKNFG